jgi:hypothetical protein
MKNVSIEPEYIDFDVIKEDWNLYEIEENRTKIKAKLVLIKMVRVGVDDIGNPIYDINSQSVFGTISPKELIKNPSTRRYSPKEISDSIVEEDLKFKIVKEDWNEYVLKDAISFNLSIKLVITKVDKTSLFDERGEPIYSFQSQFISKGSIPKELREKLLKLAKKSST